MTEYRDEKLDVSSFIPDECEQLKDAFNAAFPKNDAKSITCSRTN